MEVAGPLGTPLGLAPSLGFSRQEHWSGLPCPSPGDLPDPGIKPWSPALQADSLLSEPPGAVLNTTVQVDPAPAGLETRSGPRQPSASSGQALELEHMVQYLPRLSPGVLEHHPPLFPPPILPVPFKFPYNLYHRDGQLW